MFTCQTGAEFDWYLIAGLHIVPNKADLKVCNGRQVLVWLTDFVVSLPGWSGMHGELCNRHRTPPKKWEVHQDYYQLSLVGVPLVT